MATIPRSALDYLTREINVASADAQAKVLRVLERIEWTPENIAECREIVLQALAQVMPTYTDMAAQAAADFYDAERELSVGEPFGATAISGYEPGRTESAVRAFVQTIVDGKPVQTFNDQVLQRMDYEMKRSAGNSMLENGRNDPKGPRFARVPTGSETCEFCLMLASRGFVYRSEKSAGALDHYHANCDCRIVASFDADSVEGYDPGAYLEMWQKIRDMKDDAVPISQREAVIAAMRDRLMPDAPASPVELPGIYQIGMDSSWSDFVRSGKTPDSYEATVGVYLKNLSDAAGVEISGSWVVNDRGRYVFAKPDGFELWAAVAIAGRDGPVTFLPSDRSMSPDIKAESGYIEIKTPVSVGKVAARLSHAAKQLAAVDDRNGSVYLSLIRLEDADAVIASETASRFVEDGTIRNLFTISASGEVTRAK